LAFGVDCAAADPSISCRKHNVGSVKWILEILEWAWRLFKPQQERRILIVEDNPDDVELLQAALRPQKGFTVAVAHTAEAALALIARNQIAVAFVDLGLQYMPGAELVERIWLTSPNSRIVVITGDVRGVERIDFTKWIILMQKPPNAEQINDILRALKL
jgi:DNA-binding response OmpR family regulator